jgi:hypothetical protein
MAMIVPIGMATSSATPDETRVPEIEHHDAVVGIIE